MSKWDQIQQDPEFQALSPEEKQQFAQVYTMRSGDSVAGVSSLGRSSAEVPEANNGLGAQFGAGIDETQAALWQTTADVMDGFGFANATAYASRQAKNNTQEASKVGYQVDSMTNAFGSGDLGDILTGGLERTVRSAPIMAATVGASFIPGVGTAASLGLAGASQYGGIRQEQIETGNENKVNALLGAAGGAVLERVGLSKLGLLKGTGVTTTGLPAKLGNVVKGIGSEGVTEAGQEAIAAVAAGERDAEVIAARSLESSLSGGLSGGYLTTGKQALEGAYNITMGNGEAGQAVLGKFTSLGKSTNMLFNGDVEGAASDYADRVKASTAVAQNSARNSPEFLNAIDDVYEGVDGLKYTVEADILQELVDSDTPIDGNIFDDDMSQRYEFNEGLGYKIGSKLQNTFAADQEIEQLNRQKSGINKIYEGVRANTNQILSGLQRQMRGTLGELNLAKKMKSNATTDAERAAAQHRINELTSLRSAYSEDLSLVRGIYEGIKVGAPDASPEKIKLAMNFDLAAGTNLATMLQKASVAKGMDSKVTENKSLREGNKAERAGLSAALAVGTGGVSVLGQAIVGRAGTAMKRRAQRKAVKDRDFRKEAEEVFGEGVDTAIQSELNPSMQFDATIADVDQTVAEAVSSDTIRADEKAYSKVAADQGSTSSSTGNSIVDELQTKLKTKTTTSQDIADLTRTVKERKDADEAAAVAERASLDEALAGAEGGKNTDPLALVRGALAGRDAKNRAKKEADAAKQDRKETTQVEADAEKQARKDADQKAKERKEASDIRVKARQQKAKDEAKTAAEDLKAAEKATKEAEKAFSASKKEQAMARRANSAAKRAEAKTAEEEAKRVLDEAKDTEAKAKKEKPVEDVSPRSETVSKSKPPPKKIVVKDESSKKLTPKQQLEEVIGIIDIKGMSNQDQKISKSTFASVLNNYKDNLSSSDTDKFIKEYQNAKTPRELTKAVSGLRNKIFEETIKGYKGDIPKGVLKKKFMDHFKDGGGVKKYAEAIKSIKEDMED